MDTAELQAALKIHLKGLGELFEDDVLSEALSSALRELGWTVPVTREFRIYWILERAKRACVSMMCLDTAYSFKFKQINLQHRFEHFLALIKEMDKQFEAAKEAFPMEFAGENVEDMTSEEKMGQFGDYHGPGFCHTLSGRFR